MTYLGVKQKFLNLAAVPVLLEVQIDGFVCSLFLLCNRSHVVIDSRDQNSTRRVHQAAYERHTGDKGRWKLQVCGVLALEQSLRDPPGAAADLRPAL